MSRKALYETYDTKTGIRPLGNSYNRVFKLNGGFFKCASQEGHFFAATLERMVSDIALICGNSLITPTKAMNLVIFESDSRKFLSDDHSQTIHVIDKNGEIISCTQSFLKGSFQKEEEGILFSEFFNSPKQTLKLPFETLMKGIVTAVVFGMSDLHGGNIMITENGTGIKFFDNAQSFHHSNVSKNRGETLMAPFRCHLLKLTECYEKLDDTQLDLIQEEMLRYQILIGEVKNTGVTLLDSYLNSFHKEFKQLPPFWMDVEAAIRCFRERLENITQALNQKKVHYLRDIVLAAFPYFKFYALLKIFDKEIRTQIIDCQAKPELIQSLILSDVGSEQSLKHLLFYCSDKGVNPRKILQISQKYSFDRALLKVLNKFNQSQSLVTYAEEAHSIFFELREKSPIDFKEISADDISVLLYENVLQDCRYFGIPLSEEGNFYIKTLYHHLNKFTLKLKVDEVWLSLEFDHRSFPGKVVCLDSFFAKYFKRPLTIRELKEKLLNQDWSQLKK